MQALLQCMMTKFHNAYTATHALSVAEMNADIPVLYAQVSFWPIVLKRSFLGDERNFLRPLMRFARGDVRAHIVSHKNDHGPSYQRYRGLQRLRRLRINLREIFRCRRFSTFATWGNSGIEPDKGKGISSPGTYEASLMWPCNDGELQWNIMSDWTCR
jgi:hypothetical protein